MTLVSLTDSTFNEFLKKHKNVVVDFWATWCHPCLEMEPRISDLSNQYHGQVSFAKMDTDENTRTTRRFRINSIPAILAFKEGVLVDKSIGAISKRELTKFLVDAFGVNQRQ
jgi:thioredoxin 1